MGNKVQTTPYFHQRAKRLLKKYPSLAKTLVELEATLLKNPRAGSSYGHNIYKIRIEGEGKGKSGGYRIITYVVEITKTDTLINLVTIFTKTEESTIAKTEALKLIKTIF